MANTLTSLAQTLYRAYNEVPMEATGFLDSLGANWNAEAVGINATVKVPVITPRAIESVPTPAMTWTAGTDSVTSTRDFTLTGVAQYSFNMTAEEEKYLSIPDNVTAMEMLRLNLEQGKRVIRNTIEAAVGAALNVNASRAIGSAGTAPFGSDITMLNEAIRQLQLNGAADSGRVGILNFNAGYNLRSIAQLQKINESAGDMIDVITVAGDTVNKYVVKTGSTAASGNIVIQEPGILTALADDAAITVTATHVANIVAAPWSTKIIARPLAQPQSPAVEQLVLSDAKGWSCNLIRVVGDQMASWYMRVAYGAFVPNPFGVIKIMG
jgi:hypothetical protein